MPYSFICVESKHKIDGGRGNRLRNRDQGDSYKKGGVREMGEKGKGNRVNNIVMFTR